MNNDAIPFRYSERQFRRYEKHIDTIVSNWPTPSRIDPKPFSVETVSCRLRDAIASLREHQWKTFTNMAKFFQCCDEIVVSTSVEPGCVVAGPRESLIKYVTPGQSLEDFRYQPAPLIRLTDPPMDVIRAVIVMHAYRIFTEPSTITTTENLKTYEDLYDVTVVREGDIWTIF